MGDGKAQVTVNTSFKKPFQLSNNSDGVTALRLAE